jgi:hypothetical protein
MRPGGRTISLCSTRHRSKAHVEAGTSPSGSRCCHAGGGGGVCPCVRQALLPVGGVHRRPVGCQRGAYRRVAAIRLRHMACVRQAPQVRRVTLAGLRTAKCSAVRPSASLPPGSAPALSSAFTSAESPSAAAQWRGVQSLWSPASRFTSTARPSQRPARVRCRVRRLSGAQRTFCWTSQVRSASLASRGAVVHTCQGRDGTRCSQSHALVASGAAPKARTTRCTGVMPCPSASSRHSKLAPAPGQKRCDCWGSRGETRAHARTSVRTQPHVVQTAGGQRVVQRSAQAVAGVDHQAVGWCCVDAKQVCRRRVGGHLGRLNGGHGPASGRGGGESESGLQETLPTL